MRKIDRVKILVGLLIVGAVVLHIFHADDWLPKESEHQGLHQLHRGWFPEPCRAHLVS